MDHLPNTARRALDHIRVPYLSGDDCTSKYDNKGFKFFPERRGWDSNAFLCGSYKQNQGTERLASFLQEWLYFGFLSEALGAEVLTEDFIEEIDNQSFIHTRLLPRYINQWQNEASDLEENEKEEIYMKLLRHFRDADLYFQEASHILPGEIQLSLSILHATIVFAAKHIFRNEDDNLPSEISEFVQGIPAPFMRTLLRRQHWCPSDIALLEQGGLGSTSSLELYYAYLLGPRKVVRDHSRCASTFDGNFVCKALIVNEDTYEPKHVNSCQGDCEVIEADEDWIGGIYQENRLPLITISVSDAGLPSLATHSGDFTMEYVALSHVYADGLGNPRKCGLPACQLIRLQSHVNLLDSQDKSGGSCLKNVFFWMDTLCIPVNSYDARKVAIRSMAQIYSKARAVLVLGGELQHHPCDASREKLLMKVSTCGWFRRLWTLQEGVLANRLYFQFNNGAVEVEALQTAGESMRDESLHGRFSVSKRLQAQALKPYARIRAFRNMTREQRIRAIYPLIHWRATSHDEDEPYCLAVLLLVQNEALQKITMTRDCSKRRTEFILGQQLFPVQSLFFCEARIGTWDPPIGWALRSYLYRSEPELDYSSTDKLALLDKEGLHVNLSGVTVAISDLPADYTTTYQLPSFTFRSKVTADGDACRFEVSSCFWLRCDNPPKCWSGLGHLFDAARIGIIFENWPLGSQDHLGPSAAGRTFSQTRGAIIAISEEVQDKIIGFFCGTAVISKTPELFRTRDQNTEEPCKVFMPKLAEFLGVDLAEALKCSGDDLKRMAMVVNSHAENHGPLLGAVNSSPDAEFVQGHGEDVSKYAGSTKEWRVK